MDDKVIGWVKFLDPMNMASYSDYEIWAAWKNCGEVIIADHVATADKVPNYNHGIVAQSETLKKLAAAIHKHVAQQRRAAAVGAVTASSTFTFTIDNTTTTPGEWALNSAGHWAIESGAKDSYTVVDEPPPPTPPEPLRHDFSIVRGPETDRARFCSHCGRVFRHFHNVRCVPVGSDARMARMEKYIATMMRWPNGKDAKRLQRLEDIEHGGKPRDLKSWGPRFPVEQFTRRYADVVGGWNKRAVK
jgi:hypothetical protein